MLSAVRVPAPELLKFVYSAYSVPSQLYCGDASLLDFFSALSKSIFVIQSAEGVQQGDHLDPLLFCLTIQPLVLKL